MAFRRPYVGQYYALRQEFSALARSRMDECYDSIQSLAESDPTFQSGISQWQAWGHVQSQIEKMCQIGDLIELRLSGQSWTSLNAEYGLKDLSSQAEIAFNIESLLEEVTRLIPSFPQRFLLTTALVFMRPPERYNRMDLVIDFIDFGNQMNELCEIE